MGAGASLTFRGGVEAALETSSMTGFRTYAGVEAGAVVSGGIDFSGGSDGLDVTASSVSEMAFQQMRVLASILR